MGLGGLLAGGGYRSWRWQAGVLRNPRGKRGSVRMGDDKAALPRWPCGANVR
jgi:hypothetical protein